MPTLTPDDLSTEEQQGAEDLSRDLGVLSCFAAAEIDRLIRGVADAHRDHVALLKQKLESWIPNVQQRPRSLSDSNTMVAIAMALPDVGAHGRLTEVVTRANVIKDQLVKIVDAPDAFDSPEGKRSSGT